MLSMISGRKCEVAARTREALSRRSFVTMLVQPTQKIG